MESMFVMIKMYLCKKEDTVSSNLRPIVFGVCCGHERASLLFRLWASSARTKSISNFFLKSKQSANLSCASAANA